MRLLLAESLLWPLALLAALLVGTHGLRLRLYWTHPGEPRAAMPSGAQHGLFRAEYESARFLGPAGTGVDLTVDRAWEAGAGPEERAIRWTGWLELPRDGDWGFATRSDDGSLLCLDGWPIVSSWGRHRALTRWRTVHMEKGFHRLRLDYFQQGGNAEMHLLWRPPGGAGEAVPPGALWWIPAGGWHAQEPPHALGLAGAGAGPSREDLARALVAQPTIPYGTIPALRARLVMPWTCRCKLLVDGPSGARLTLDGQPQSLERGASLQRVIAVGTHTLGLSFSPGLPAASGRIPSDSARCVVEPIVSPGVPLPLIALAVDASAQVEADADIDGIAPPGPPVLEELAAQIDHRSGAALMAPYIERWDSAVQGHPANVAPLRATWDGDLEVPRTGTYTVSVRGQAAAALILGPHRLEKRAGTEEVSGTFDLAAGALPLTLDAFEPGLLRRLTLAWIPPGGVAEPVPTWALDPPDAAVRRMWRGGLALAAGLLLVLAVRRSGGVRRYGAVLEARAGVHVWLCLLALGLALRLDHYAVTPPPGETDDELNTLMQGQSIAAGEVPIGWEPRGSYDVARAVPLHGRVFKIVAPMVAYPPAFHALVGWVSRLAGGRSPFDANLHVARLVPIMLSMLALALLWPAARALGFSSASALLGTAFLALCPTVVVSSRLLKEENLLAPLGVALLWLVALHWRRPGPWTRLGMGLLVILAVLTKQMGCASVFVAVAGLGQARQWRAAGVLLLYGIAGAGLWLLWGIAHAGPLFLAVQRAYLPYADGLDVLWPLLAQNAVTDLRIGNAWMLGLWLALIATVARPGRGRPGARLVALAVVAQLMAVAASYSPRLDHGWYRIPLLPLLALAWGVQTRRLLARYDPLRALLWTGLFLLPSLEILLGGHVWTWPWPLSAAAEAGRTALALRLLLCVLVLPGLAIPVLPRASGRRVAAALASVLIVAIGASFVAIVMHWRILFPAGWPDDPITGLNVGA